LVYRERGISGLVAGP